VNVKKWLTGLHFWALGRTFAGLLQINHHQSVGQESKAGSNRQRKSGNKEE